MYDSQISSNSARCPPQIKLQSSPSLEKGLELGLPRWRQLKDATLSSKTFQRNPLVDVTAASPAVGAIDSSFLLIPVLQLSHRCSQATRPGKSSDQHFITPKDAHSHYHTPQRSMPTSHTAGTMRTVRNTQTVRTKRL